MGSTYRSGGADIFPNTSLKGALGSLGGATVVSATNTLVVVNFTGLGNVTFQGQNLVATGGGINWAVLTGISGFSSQITDLGGVAAGGSGYGDIYNLVMGVNSQGYVNADTGDQADADLYGNADNNALFGGPGRNYIEGAGGADQLVGGPLNDTFRLYYGDFVASESISGGQGTDTIEVKLNTNPGSTADVDLSTGNISQIEVLRYLGTIQSNVLIGNHVTISAQQAIASNGNQALAVWFDGAQDSLTINNIGGGPANPDFSTMAFTGYSAAADTVTFNMVASANSPGGTNLGIVKTTIVNDIVDLANVTSIGLNTWTGDDTIIVRGTTLVMLGLDGGTGTDILKLENATLDFATQGSITGMEGILFDTGTSIVTFSQAEVNAGVVPAITGSANVDTVVIAGAITIDASTLVLNSWTEGVDTLKLIDVANNTATSFTGSSHRDTIFGNNGLDTLNGKGGADSLFGGTGADKFVFDAMALSDAQSGIFDTVKDYDQGGGSAYNSGEGDQIDLSALLTTAYNHGSGQPIVSLVRAVEDASGTFANLQIDSDGAANGVNWTTIARLDGLQIGNAVNVLLDPALPGGSVISVTAEPVGSVSINDVSTGEGNSGTKVETFTVTRTGGTGAFDVNFATADGSATVADGDYVANSGTVHFNAGVNTQTISVTINGDRNIEPAETFSVNLSGATNGATISDNQGVGTIANDEFFGQPAVKLAAAFNPDNGWTSQDQFTRHLADVNGDGMADIVGFGIPGVRVALATGGGNFAASEIKLAAFNPANGWTSDDTYHRELADVNGDGMADIVGFGIPGVRVALATGGGNFAASEIRLAAFNPANGWTSQDTFHRELADVNGDGMADIVGFGIPGVMVALATGGGNFATPQVKLAGAFNPANGWTSQDAFHRELADVNGDGMADIVGFGNGGVYVALATGGGNFAPFNIDIAAFHPANGWTSDNQFHRQLADVNHDGMADIVGFGNGGVYVAAATGGGHFAAPIIDIPSFNPANGWTSDDAFHREVADVNGDGSADIVGFGIPGVLVALANDFHLI